MVASAHADGVQFLKKASCLTMKHLNKTPKVIVKNTSVGSSASKTSSLLGGMYRVTSRGRTDNGADTFIRSGSLLVDFYAQAGAMRRNPEKALDLFKAAFAEDRQTAVRILFYLRDVRGGQGERDLFRTCIEWLGTTYPAVFNQIVDFIPEFGRWDDMLFDDPRVWEIINKQIVADMETDTPSLLAKWLPTINASSPTTRTKAHAVAKALGMEPIEYRRIVRGLRKKIKTVEEKMSARKWDEINYSAVPSQAARIYKDAFKKHDEARYSEFIGKAEKGEVKINAGTLYPYQIYKDVMSNYSQTLEALWNQLPDYTRGNNALVVADTSGSMAGDPIAVSVSLALYFAERNKGIFKDHFITFSARPRLQKVVGKTLLDKMNALNRAEWDSNTDLAAVFRLILDTAVTNKVPAEEMPETIYIISDMQFDYCVQGQTLYEFAKESYAKAGYKIPTVVFWQVNASGDNLPVMRDEIGTALVSGFSPTIFKQVVENKTPEQVMLDTINSERYAKIVLE